MKILNIFRQKQVHSSPNLKVHSIRMSSHSIPDGSNLYYSQISENLSYICTLSDILNLENNKCREIVIYAIVKQNNRIEDAE